MGTVGVDMFTKKLSIDGQNIGLTIWDFGGEEKFRSLLPRYCMGTQGAMFLFDLTKHLSFEALENWLQIINKYIPESKKILIASKADLANQREVSEDEAIEFQQNQRIDLYLECSSKTGQNVDEIFDSLMNAILSSFIKCPFAMPPIQRKRFFVNIVIGNLNKQRKIIDISNYHGIPTCSNYFDLNLFYYIDCLNRE